MKVQKPQGSLALWLLPATPHPPPSLKKCLPNSWLSPKFLPGGQVSDGQNVQLVFYSCGGRFRAGSGSHHSPGTKDIPRASGGDPLSWSVEDAPRSADQQRAKASPPCAPEQFVPLQETPASLPDSKKICASLASSSCSCAHPSLTALICFTPSFPASSPALCCGQPVIRAGDKPSPRFGSQ